MAGRRRVRGAAQHHLVDHELAVVFAERAVGGAIARIGRIGAARPLPHDAEGVVDQPVRAPRLPIRLRSADPCRSSARTHRPRSSSRGRPARPDRPARRPAERQREPGAVDLAPVAWRVPAFGLHRRPAVGQPERRRRVAAVGDEIEPLRVGDERRAIRTGRR